MLLFDEAEDEEDDGLNDEPLPPPNGLFILLLLLLFWLLPFVDDEVDEAELSEISEGDCEAGERKKRDGLK